MEWIPCSNEFEKIISRMTIPRVVIDNASCPNSTIIKVDSARKHGILLEAVQVLTDQNVCIKKAYISSDGRWFMDVFHVTDLNGNKLADKSVISYMEESLGTIHDAKLIAHEGLTALELTGTDRIGLLSEVFAVLSELQCNVVDAKLWTHNRRIASLIYVKDMDSGSHIEDSDRLSAIIARLRSVLKGDNDIRGARTSVSLGMTHTERRLHQMMFDDRDYERVVPIVSGFVEPSPVVTVYNCMEWGYSVVNINCKDRIKLMFDVVCTLTDMDYVVFHATVNAESSRVYMEFYIRHRDGTPISSDAEMQRVIQCLQASIERRTTQGVRLELCTDDKPALLAEVTRTFRENCLNVTRAEISTKGDVAVNIFYVTDGKGFLPDKKTIEEVRKKVGSNELIVKELPLMCQQEEGDEEGGGGAVGAGGAMLLSLGSLVRRNLYNLGLIRSHS